MNQPKLTPGPWELDRASSNSISIISSKTGMEVATILADPDTDEITWEDKANARAIAATHELLDVTLTLVNQFSCAGIAPVENSNDPAEMLHYKATQAIAKATRF